MSTPTILEQIKAYKLEHIAACKEARPLGEVEAAARGASRVRPFGNALFKSIQSGYGLIAESVADGIIRMREAGK